MRSLSGLVLLMAAALALAAPRTAMAAKTLTFSTLPSSHTSGRVLPTFTVTALDGSSPVSSLSVTIALTTPTTGFSIGGTLSATTNASGVATFSNVTVTATTPPASKQLRATATGGYTQDSSSISFIAEQAPVLPAIGARSVNENQNLNFTLTAATDANGDSLTYSTGTLPSGATFNAGTRVFDWTPGYTAAASSPYTVRFTVTDSTARSDFEDVQITVNNVNRSPTVNAAGPFSIAENSANGTSVGTAITASDPDTGEAATLSLSIFSGNTGNAFAINSSSGQLTVNSSAALNHEATPSYSLTIRATDVHGGTDDEVVTVNVTNVNEAPTVNAAGPFSLAENSANGTPVGTVTASDPDSGQTATLAFSITGGNTGGAFAIDSGTGAITVNASAALDYETNPAFTLTVRATDANGASDEESVTVNLTNVSEAPTVNAAGPFSVAENSEDGTVVGTVTASDSDAGQTATLSFSLTGGNTGDAFSINASTGQITVDTHAALDYETNPTFTLTIRATDTGGLSDEEFVTINLSDVNEGPTANAAGPFSLAENSADATSVGTVTASDPDDGDDVTFSIEGGNTGNAFAIGGTSGAITVNASSALDYETNPTFTLTIRGTDGDGAWDEEDVTVNLTDVNEAPTVNAAGPFSLAENSANGTSVGTVTASDPDDGQTATLTFSIEGGNTGGAFAIGASTGTITVNTSAALDYETSPTFTLTIRATDVNAAWDEASVTVNLTDEGEAPTAGDSTFSVSETASNGSVVGTVAASDADDGDTLTYAITAGNESGTFAIDPNTGQITVADSANLDADGTPSYVLTVTVTDDDDLTDSCTITINVTAPPSGFQLLNVSFEIYNQGRGMSGESHVRAFLSDSPPSAAHALGDGKDVELPLEMLSVSPTCSGEGCTPSLLSAQSVRYGSSFEMPLGGFGRHVVSDDPDNDAVPYTNGTFALSTTTGTWSSVTFLYGRYLLVQGDAQDEAMESLAALKANNRQGRLVGTDAPTFEQITYLSATFQASGGGDGTPYLDVYLEGHGKLRIRLGSSPDFDDADAAMNGTYSNFNVIGDEDAGRYDTSGLVSVGGPTSSSTTFADARTLAGEYTIEKIEFVASDPGTTGSRNYLLTSINVSTGGDDE